MIDDESPPQWFVDSRRDFRRGDRVRVSLGECPYVGDGTKNYINGMIGHVPDDHGARGKITQDLRNPLTRRIFESERDYDFYSDRYRPGLNLFQRTHRSDHPFFVVFDTPTSAGQHGGWFAAYELEPIDDR